MKIYEVVNIRERSMVEEFVEYLGTDLEKAKETKENVLLDNQKYLTEREKKYAAVEGRVYDVPDNTDINDEEALNDAICECCGYDLF